MNETKKAIEHFHYGITHDIFSEPIKTYARLAIDALREKVECDKGCEYCNSKEFGPWLNEETVDYSGIVIDFSCEAKALRVRTLTTQDVANIIHCPMCGRRLEKTECTTSTEIT